MEGVVQGEPVPMEVPPEGTVYQFILYEDEAFKEELFPQLTEDGVAVTIVGVAGTSTVSVTDILNVETPQFA